MNERLFLLPGSYEIDATIADHSIAHIHDHLEHGTRFDVGLPDSFPMHQGVVDLDGTFSAPVFEGPMTASAGT